MRTREYSDACPVLRSHSTPIYMCRYVLRELVAHTLEEHIRKTLDINRSPWRIYSMHFIRLLPGSERRTSTELEMKCSEMLRLAYMPFRPMGNGNEINEMTIHLFLDTTRCDVTQCVISFCFCILRAIIVITIIIEQI